MYMSVYSAHTHLYDHLWEYACARCAVLWAPTRRAPSLLGSKFTCAWGSSQAAARCCGWL